MSRAQLGFGASAPNCRVIPVALCGSSPAFGAAIGNRRRETVNLTASEWLHASAPSQSSSRRFSHEAAVLSGKEALRRLAQTALGKRREQAVRETFCQYA